MRMHLVPSLSCPYAASIFEFLNTTLTFVWVKFVGMCDVQFFYPEKMVKISQYITSFL